MSLSLLSRLPSLCVSVPSLFQCAVQRLDRREGHVVVDEEAEEEEEVDQEVDVVVVVVESLPLMAVAVGHRLGPNPTGTFSNRKSTQKRRVLAMPSG